MKIAVAGTGYVGLVAGVCFAEKGHDVTCVDVDENKVRLMESGISPIYEEGLQELMQKNNATGRLHYTTDYQNAYRDVDAIFIGVGTPEQPDGSANLSYIATVSRQIAESVERDCLVVVKSTVPVGTNDKVEQFIRDFLIRDVKIEVASNPEFLAQGSAVHDTLHAARIIIGTESREAEEASKDAQTKVQTRPEEDNTAKAESSYQVNETQMVQNTVTDVTEVVKEVMPSVVSVNKRYIERMSFWGQEYSQEGNGSGSGIIVGQNDTELLLVSNYHVVESPEELTVQFVDGSQAQAQIKGMDADKDLAVIAVQLSDISSDTMEQISIARMGNSDALSLGEPVIAIGNALGYGQSVTTGVVSALDRPIAASTVQTDTQEDTEINTFIQTNAAINPGNSGGALLNMKGEVIGITSNKIGGNAVEGMGYAIPISDAEPIIEKLMTRETKLKVDEEKKGYLGITGLDVASEYSQLYDAPRGVYVSSVTEGSGADEAGLVRGDIIVAIDDEEITSMMELRDYLDYCEAGSTVTLTIMQGSPLGYQSKTVEVTLGLQSNLQ